jgi:hypothetical protein
MKIETRNQNHKPAVCPHKEQHKHKSMLRMGIEPKFSAFDRTNTVIVHTALILSRFSSQLKHLEGQTLSPHHSPAACILCGFATSLSGHKLCNHSHPQLPGDRLMLPVAAGDSGCRAWIPKRAVQEMNHTQITLSHTQSL